MKIGIADHEEKWVFIKDSNKKYEVSNMGNVRTFKTGLIRKPYRNRDGYMYVSISINGKSKSCKIHRLVCEHFVTKSCESKTHVDHIDGNKLNNVYSNLRWCTHKENIQYAHELGIYKQKGEDHPLSILNESQVREIKKRLSNGEKTVNIYSDYGVKINAIYDIKQGRTWTHIK